MWPKEQDILYPALHRMSDKKSQTFPLKSLLHCTVAAYETPSITRKATEKKAASIILLFCKPRHACIWSAACIPGLTGSTQQDISYVLANSVGFTHCNLIYLALLNLSEFYCLTLALTGRKTNSACAFWHSPEIKVFPLHILHYVIAPFYEKFS